MKDKIVYPYPSLFGSHDSMINVDETAKVCMVESEFESRSSGRIICTDEFGDYETSEFHMNSGLADPNRCRESRLTKLFNKKKEEKS